MHVITRESINEVIGSTQGWLAGWLVEWCKLSLHANEPRLFRAVTSMEHHFGHFLVLSCYMLCHANVTRIFWLKPVSPEKPCQTLMYYAFENDKLFKNSRPYKDIQNDYIWIFQWHLLFCFSFGLSCWAVRQLSSFPVTLLHHQHQLCYLELHSSSKSDVSSK